VLWLLEDNPTAAENLRLEAVRRGIQADRLVFAQRRPHAEHLARHRCADLFLDTLPYNAHTTASDALWAGLPVLTCAGGTFPGRVAASLLGSLQLTELIAATLDEYEKQAIALAFDRNRLSSLTRKLDEHRPTSALFDARRYTQNLEAAYRKIYERYQSGEAPGMICI
jgi:predicted O-linked N-acetylglucosamine transferase (SPINDLY family)